MSMGRYTCGERVLVWRPEVNLDFFFLNRVSYWDLRLADEAILAGQQIPGIHLSMSTGTQDYKHTPAQSTIHGRTGHETRKQLTN